MAPSRKVSHGVDYQTTLDRNTIVTLLWCFVFSSLTLDSQWRSCSLPNCQLLEHEYMCTRTYVVF